MSGFVRDERGSIALNFALASTALIMCTGAALDFTRSSNARTELQNAADSAALAIARTAGSITSSDTLKQLVTSHMATMLPTAYSFTVTSATKVGNTVKVVAEGSVPAGLTGVMGYKTLKQKVASETTWGTGKLEVALVLDNTGSMGDFGRMTELKKAANTLLDELSTSDPGLVKIGIVPFDVNVKVPTTYKTASWFKSDWWVSWFWKGCIADRDQPYDAGDAAVTSAAATKYPGALCSSDSLVSIQPLTDNFTTLYSKVNAMTPSGNTNITIGLAWGMAVLSSQDPYTEGAAPGTKDLSRAIVLMTDGANTENRWTTSATSIDARTQLACQAAKDGGIKVYVVRLVEGNSTLLKSCASSEETYYDVDVSDLVPAFKAIGEQLSQLHLSS
jgi:Flp pilus assembly protein TadG